MEDKKNSYTAADNIPTKLILDEEVKKAIKRKRIIPIHAQFIPTNKCNMNCPFCSCAEDDRQTEMSWEDAHKIIKILKGLGCKAVTITGGGEPLVHPKIKEIINMFWANGIKIGLVTNGLLLRHIDPRVLNKLTWCRISNGDFREMNKKYAEYLEKVVTSCPDVDWAFSHVVGRKPNIKEIARIVEFARIHDFTHVRLVADLMEPKKVPMELVELELKDIGLSLDHVIFQGRKKPTLGSDCYICYLKPLIGADCKVYACCGVQYALDPPSKKLPQELCLGHAFDLPKIIANSNKPLNGNICKRCYYNNYNTILKAMLSDIKHQEFV